MSVKFTTFFVLIFAFSSLSYAKCTSLNEKIYYLIKKGDHIAKVLRGFNLVPIFCTDCSLASLLKINNYENKDLIQPKDEVALPFRCKEDYMHFQMTEIKNKKFLMFKQNTYEAILSSKTEFDPSVGIISIPMPSVNLPTPKSSTPTYKQIVVSSRSTGYLVENGQNDFAKIDCNGYWNLADNKCEVLMNELYIGLSNSLNKIDYSLLNNSSGTASSYINPSLHLNWIHFFKTNFRSYLGSSINYHDLSKFDLNLSSKNTDTYEFNLGLSYQLQSWNLQFGFSKESKYYLSSSASNDNSVSKVYPDFFQFRVTHSWDIADTLKIAPFINLKNSFNSTSSANLKPNKITTFSLGTSLKTNLKNHEFFNSFTFDLSLIKEESSTNISDQSSSSIRLGIGKYWILD